MELRYFIYTVFDVLVYGEMLKIKKKNLRSAL